MNTLWEGGINGGSKRWIERKKNREKKGGEII